MKLDILWDDGSTGDEIVDDGPWVDMDGRGGSFGGLNSGYPIKLEEDGVTANLFSSRWEWDIFPKLFIAIAEGLAFEAGFWPSWKRWWMSKLSCKITFITSEYLMMLHHYWNKKCRMIITLPPESNLSGSFIHLISVMFLVCSEKIFKGMYGLLTSHMLTEKSPTRPEKLAIW